MTTKSKQIASANAVPLVIDRLHDRWERIMVYVIAYVNESYNEDQESLTIRQGHYHLVHKFEGETYTRAGDSLPLYRNVERDYDNLTGYMVRARISGHIGWHMITEYSSIYSHEHIPLGLSPEESVEKSLDSAINYVGDNPWEAIGKFVMLISEKRELVPQFRSVIEPYCVPAVYLPGYGMWTRMEKVANVLSEKIDNGLECHVLFVTDHDGPGIDIYETASLALTKTWELPIVEQRVLLTRDQIEKWELSPIPSKHDPTSRKYAKRHSGAWEIDALDKRVMQQELRDTIAGIIKGHIDEWNVAVSKLEKEREKTRVLVERVKDII